MKVYINKGSGVIQTSPVPPDLSNWDMVNAVNETAFRGKKFDGSKRVFVDPIIVPSSVTRRQARKAMDQRGILSVVESYIGTLPLTDQIDYTDASVFERSNPLVEQVKVSLGLSDNDLDSLFILAASL